MPDDWMGPILKGIFGEDAPPPDPNEIVLWSRPDGSYYSPSPEARAELDAYMQMAESGDVKEPEDVQGFVGLTEDHALIHNGERGQFVVLDRGDGTVLRVPHEPTDGDRERLRELNEQLRRAL